MSIELAVVKSAYADEIDWAFPKVDSEVHPLGGRILLQIRRIRKKSAGGLVLMSETRDVEKFNTQLARVVELGLLAFRRKDDLSPWPEGVWANVGDFVRCPRYGGDRFEIAIEGEDEPALFVIVNDHELIAKVTGDPLKQKAYL